MTTVAIEHEVINTTEGCRYCLMCRHVCPVARATYNEATSPHGWALTIASVKRGLLDWNAETADLLYQCADCGLCQSFCATDQPLPFAIAAARAEVAAGGRAPAAVSRIDANLRQWGHPYAGSHSLPPFLTAAKEGEELHPSPIAMADGPGVRAETALFIGAAAWHRERGSLEAAGRLLEAAGVEHGLVGAGRSSGYLAYTLGLRATARELAQATVDELQRAGCRTLVVLSPQQAHTFTAIYPLLGVPLPQGVEVVELTALLATLLDQGRLRLRPATIELAYHDPCQTPRLAERWRAPRRLLEALNAQPPRGGFWREQRAASCGASGGLPWTQPQLAGRMARQALADATNDGARLIVTDAPGCLAHLRANAEGMGVQVRGLYELLAGQLGES